jgi:uncharacterized protein (TIGR03000 family)
MTRYCARVLASVLATVSLEFGSSASCAAGEGHGAGAGHVLVPVHGGRYGCGPRFRGYCGYPACYGFGLGYGWWYGYPYFPYDYGYAVYVDPVLPSAPYAGTRADPPSSRELALVPPGNRTNPSPVHLTETDVLLSIRVPPDAVVRINDVATTQSGPRREFISSGLEPGRTYTFIVSAQLLGANGQRRELEQRVQVRGGERWTIDFVMPSLPPQHEPQPMDRIDR